VAASKRFGFKFHIWEHPCRVQLKIWNLKGPPWIICMNMQISFAWLDWSTYLHVGHIQYSNIFCLCKIISTMAEVGSIVWFKSARVVALFLWLDIWGYHLCRRSVLYVTYHLFNWWYLCYLVSIQDVESTISATATIDKSCDERLDVEKRFPSLVSRFLFLLMHKIA